ncbi:MAG: prolyl oligopeptidase family serine peptidase [Clostridia bacterium]|nr:prolyl oligopeptidase family serine peptidase [Clostridia bacterium]
MKRADYCPDAFLDGLYGALKAEPFGNAHDAPSARAAAEAVRKQLRELLALPLLEEMKTDAAPVPVGKALRTKDYTIRKYAHTILPGLTTAVYLLTPTELTAPAPGVAALCGHGYGVRQIIGVTKTDRLKRLPYFDDYQKHFALELVKRGCIVAAPEPVAFGQACMEKDLWKPFYASSCGTVSHRLLPYGLNTAGVRVFQTIACADFLLSLPRVDPARLGVMGVSGGGLAALYAAAADERFARAVVSGYACTFRDSILSRWHCPDNYIPGVLRAGEIGDFAAAIAPRRLLIESGTRDPLFPIEGARDAHKRARRVYALMGAADALTVDEFNGRHRVGGAYSFDFLAK